ncbi:hypothetical protein, partial [Paraclostridium bifermentans]|uniref:hypothetical protein n=1 Tax=Paraclostridium bifermentans TaxID=1490 RepID=UPI00374EF424
MRIIDKFKKVFININGSFQEEEFRNIKKEVETILEEGKKLKIPVVVDLEMTDFFYDEYYNFIEEYEYNV